MSVNAVVEHEDALVAMVDVLGGRVDSMAKARDMLDRLQRLLAAAQQQVQADVATMRGLLGSRTFGEGPLSEPDVRLFADTVLMIWAPSAQPRARYLIAGLWLQFLVLKGIEMKLPLRGALAVGGVASNQHSVLGPAVTEAAALYEGPQMLGVVAAPSVGRELAEIGPRLGENDTREYFVEYDVPCKGGPDGQECARRLWCSAWPSAMIAAVGCSERLRDRDPRDVLQDLIGCRRIPRPPEAEAKYSNTLAFFDWYSALGEGTAPRL